MKIEIDQRLLGWLATLGYQLEGQPRELAEAAFAREARQWQLEPVVLARLVWTLFERRERPPSPEGAAPPRAAEPPRRGGRRYDLAGLHADLPPLP